MAIRTARSSQSSSRKRRLATAATVLPLAIGLASTRLPSGHGHAAPTTAAAVTFSPSCTLPFEDISSQHPIDEACGLDGKAKSGSAQALQNDAKNNFCAAGPPVSVDFTLLRNLQTTATQKVSFGSDQSLPNDRTVLRHLSTSAGQIGEGSVVRIAAFVIDAHYSNVGSGESVNCKRGDTQSNDIHIVLGENSNADQECSSTTAEMSPHFRPDFWTPDALTKNNGHKFRFTGQLFFDASHTPCHGNTGENPKRSSLWEIHPVYSVDVCIDDTNAHCDVDKNSDWQTLQDFLNKGGTETHVRGGNLSRGSG